MFSIPLFIVFYANKVLVNNCWSTFLFTGMLLQISIVFFFFFLYTFLLFSSFSFFLPFFYVGSWFSVVRCRFVSFVLSFTMEVDSLQFLLRHRGNFDDVLHLIWVLLFSSPSRFFARFRPEDKELIVQLLLFSLLNNPCAPSSAFDFGFQRVWIGDYYYV